MVVSGWCRWSVKPNRPPFTSHQLRHHFRGHALGHECLDHVANFDIAVVCNRDTALHAVGDLAGVVFESAQRSDLAFKGDYVVAQ